MIMYLRILTCSTLISFASLVWLLWYWHFQPNIFTVENPTQIKVDKEVYKPWDRIIYTFTYCKTKKWVGTIDRALVDWIRITYNRLTSDSPVWCYTINVADLTIPDFVSESIYHLDMTVIHKINPIKTQKVYLLSVPFKVVK
jgi:hypothetical protein